MLSQYQPFQKVPVGELKNDIANPPNFISEYNFEAGGAVPPGSISQIWTPPCGLVHRVILAQNTSLVKYYRTKNGWI